MQMAMDVAGFDAGEADQLRRAMGAKRSSEQMERLEGRLYDGMAGTASPVTRPTRSTRSCWRSPTSGSPRRTRSASPRWSSTRPGSSCTTRRRSARRCSGRSRWASTRRSRWSPTPAGTASRCAARTSTLARAARPTWNRDAHGAGDRRSGWAWPSIRDDRHRARRADRAERAAATGTGTWTSCPPGRAHHRAGRGAGHRRRASAAFGAGTGGGRCGPPARPPPVAAGPLPGSAVGLDAPGAAGDERHRADRRRHLGDRDLPGVQPDRAPAGAARPDGGVPTAGSMP